MSADTFTNSYYRYNIRSYMNSTKICVSIYPVIRYTLKGVWIRDYSVKSDRRFIIIGASRSYAMPTPELALKSFVLRKRKELKILNVRIANVTEGLTMVDQEENKLHDQKILKRLHNENQLKLLILKNTGETSRV